MSSELLLAVVVTGGSLAVAALTILMANLVEHSGPIRLRSWSEEAGPGLRDLYRNARAFDAFRLLLRLLSWSFVLLMSMGWLALAVARGWFAPLRLAALATFALVVGIEWVSRQLAVRDTESVLERLTGIYRVLHGLLSPLISVVAWTLPARHGNGDDEPEEASAGEIDAFIDVGRREGILEPGEGELLRGLVDFGDTLVRSVMTPRVDLVAASVDSTTEQLMDLVLDSGHSRIPIYRDSIDQVVGVLHVRDLLRVVRSGGRGVHDHLQPTHFVPETKSLTELLRELQERHQELAMVVDEYGGIEGVVTIEDLLEEIFGEIVDEHDDEEPLELALEADRWRVDGRLPLADMEAPLDVDPASIDYETVGGLIFGELGRLPRPGDRVDYAGLRFTVEAADARSARRVLVAPRSEPEADGSVPAEPEPTP